MTAQPTQHPYSPDVTFDGGDLDCGNGLLLLIRKHIDPLPDGGLVEIRSREISVDEDLPAWCRLTGNELVSRVKLENERSFLVCKGRFQTPNEVSANTTADSDAGSQTAPTSRQLKSSKISMPLTQEIKPVSIPASLPMASPAKTVPPLAVMGIGSWPRPRWMLAAIHEHLQGRLAERDFQVTADDAVRLIWQYQQQAGVDVYTDGEQRRDNYASFVGGRLDNCQLIPLSDLLPYVDDPEKFEKELAALDVPAHEVRHPAVFGPLGRSQSLAVHEYEFLSKLTDRPIKVALPGPYLLTRTMWMECISDRAYDSREELATDVVRVLREELAALLHAGVTLVQFDEPVLSEVAFAQASTGGRSFMCGALSERLPVADELAFASDLFRRLTEEMPRSRIAVHICRGNWTRDESVALTGGYAPLIDFLHELPVGNFFLELCTPRAGEMEVLRELPESSRIGVGVVNQKHEQIESRDEIRQKVLTAIDMFGIERVMLTPDCGFATFAENSIASAEVAIAKLSAMAAVRDEILGRQ
jgi:5-methyltetrahydropteroyltriglutamate--homocysteine methyltransferase